jgi:hypothetical protein
MNTTAKILNDAADLIDANGWCQGEYRSLGGCYCASGAIEAAAPRTFIGYETNSRYAGSYAFMTTEIKETNVATWNDHKDRTVDQVTTALRNAALTAEKGNR